MKRFFVLAFAAIITLPASCKKENASVCEYIEWGGIGDPNDKKIMLWKDSTFRHETLTLMRCVRVETGKNEPWAGDQFPSAFLSFPSQPACGTEGAAVIGIDRGHEYRLTLEAQNGAEYAFTIDATCDFECQAVRLTR